METDTGAAEAAQLEQIWRGYVTGDPRQQLARWRERQGDVEARMSVPTLATRRVLMAVCQRYGLRVYRHPRQRQSTMCVQAPAGFMEEVFAPLLEAMAEVVEEASRRTTDRIVDGWLEQSESDGP